ncbi:MAG: DMT family transporter [Alphaproteobacteria bacterium]
MTVGDRRLRATLAGYVAVALWATLALLTAGSGGVPPFQLVAMAFGLAFCLCLGKWLIRGEDILAHLHQPAGAWALGVGCLFGFHFFYFLSLRSAPPVEANLINYTWPLLIVLFSGLLPGERLRWWHVAGVSMGLAGAVILIAGRGRVGFEAGHALGYAAAVCSALVWSVYSVANRRFAGVPTDAVGGFCGLTALLALGAHLTFETTIWPEGVMQWAAVAALGLGPVGAAFFFWDHGTKHGDIRALGAAAYAAPLLSTLLLIAVGLGEPSVAVLAACILVTGGALLASRDLFARKP